jgi:hypothetical protein
MDVTVLCCPDFTFCLLQSTSCNAPYNLLALGVWQTVFAKLKMKAASLQTDTAFDQDCRLMRELVLPAGNNYPGSYYILKRLAGVSPCHAHHHQSVPMSLCCLIGTMQMEVHD